MAEGKLQLLKLNINIGTDEGIDLPGKINKLNSLLEDYKSETESLAECVHKFKVTGEPVVLAVYNVRNVVGLERIISGIARFGHIDVECTPLLPYVQFARRLGAKEELLQRTPNCLQNETELFWLDFTVEHAGKTNERLLEIWWAEANAALGARAAGAKIELYKVVASRKVHAFFGCTAHDGNNLDDLSFTLPLMKLNGENVKIVSKSLQDLKHYCNTISG